MKRHRPATAAALVAILLLHAVGVRAGELGDFEKGLESHHDDDVSSQRRSYEDSDSDTADCSTFFECLFASSWWMWLVVPGAMVAAAPLTLYQAEHREAGDPALPFVRVDDTYQRLIHGNVNGYSARAEAGFGPAAVVFEWLRYWEHGPTDRMDAWSAAALYRVSTDPRYSLGVSAGYRRFDRERDHEGFELGTPLALYAWDPVGFEFEPRWSWFAGNVVQDYRGGIALHLPFVTVRPGYRLLRVDRLTLDGPEIDVALLW